MALTLRDDVRLADLCTLGIGGPARLYTAVSSEEEAREALGAARERGLPVLVLGGGSNLVVADSGFPGLVLHVDLRGRGWAERDGLVELRAAAGEEWDALVAFTTAQGWAGLECLAGIPGRVGATPIQNVGAYGQEVGDTIAAVEAVDLATGAARRFTGDECGFGYRDSRFKREDRGRYLVTAVTFRLEPGGAPRVRYRDLEQQLAEDGVTGAPGLEDVRRAVVKVRRRKSMVLDPADENRRSVGSFFMNPVVPADEWPRVEERLRRVAPDGSFPAYPGPGGFKLSAAWLIERAGVRRGMRHKGVGVSSRHSLALVNHGTGTAVEIAELARDVRARVEDCFGVRLVPEPVFVGLTLDDPA